MRSDFFFVRMWFLCECLLFTLPVEVKRKRFFAPEWDFIFGMGKIAGNFVIILNIDKVLSVEEIAILSGMPENPGEAALNNAAA